MELERTEQSLIDVVDPISLAMMDGESFTM